MKRMMWYTFSLWLFWLFSIAATAQVNSSRISPRDSLSYRSPIFSLYPKLYNNGNRLSNDEAIRLLSKEPNALVDYKKYRNKQKVGLYSMLGVLGFMGASTYFFQNNSRGAAGVSLTLSVYSFINSIVFLSVADAKLRKAVKRYNQYSLQY